MSLSPRRLALGAAVFAALATQGAPADARDPFLVVPDAKVVERSPAFRYANMTNGEAFAELERRKIPFVRTDATPGVRAPIRLAGRLHGVAFHSMLPPAQRATTPYEILDARLGLALDDFAAVLERHDIDEVVHFTMYRPTKSTRPGTRHPGGLAIDVARFKKRDGSWLSVAPDFAGRIGDKTCGRGTSSAPAPGARELRSLVCEAADLGVFTYVLTPNYDKAHVDHFHMEVKPGVRWFLYH